MLTYCLLCKENTKTMDAKMIKTTNGKVILPPICAICGQ